MDFALRPLPYAANALEPHLSTDTVRLHREKHHGGYLDELERLIGKSPQGGESLETIIATATGHLFDIAAQVWNHDFLWRSMKPRGGGDPPRPVAEALVQSFGGVDGFGRMFRMAAAEQFGSGWIWLVLDRGRLRVITTDDAQLPLTHGQTPLVTLDLWEHAYYLDYRNERKRYVEAFLDHLIDWDFVATNLEAERSSVNSLLRPIPTTEQLFTAGYERWFGPLYAYVSRRVASQRDRERIVREVLSENLDLLVRRREEALEATRLKSTADRLLAVPARVDAADRLRDPDERRWRRVSEEEAT